MIAPLVTVNEPVDPYLYTPSTEFAAVVHASQKYVPPVQNPLGDDGTPPALSVTLSVPAAKFVHDVAINVPVGPYTGRLALNPKFNDMFPIVSFVGYESTASFCVHAREMDKSHIVEVRTRLPRSPRKSMYERNKWMPGT